MTLSVTTSSSITVSETLVTSTDADIPTVASFTTEQSLSYTSAPDSSGLALVLGGEATAIGKDTLADATMMVDLDGTGLVATAQGSATFIAAAASPGDETALATATSFGGLSGADVQVVLTSNTQIVQQGPGGSVAVATSSMTLYGIDFDPVVASDGSAQTDPMLDPLLDSGSAELTGLLDAPPESQLAEIPSATTDGQDPVCACDQADGAELDIDGNVAILDVDAEVYGPNTLLDVEASVLTVEDTLSTISAEIIAVVG